MSLRPHLPSKFRYPHYKSACARATPTPKGRQRPSWRLSPGHMSQLHGVISGREGRPPLSATACQSSTQSTLITLLPTLYCSLCALVHIAHTYSFAFRFRWLSTRSNALEDALSRGHQPVHAPPRLPRRAQGRSAPGVAFGSGAKSQRPPRRRGV